MEEIENKSIEDLNENIDDNLVMMDNFDEIDDFITEEYYRQRNEGISQEELDEIVETKANRLIPLWRQTIEELEKLEIILLEKTPKFPAPRALSVAKMNKIIQQVDLAASLHTFIDGVIASLANLEGDDSESRSLAVVNSSPRQEILDEYLEKASKLRLYLKLEPLRELSAQLRSALGAMPDLEILRRSYFIFYCK